MKIKLFTHTDLDGVGCAVVASMFARTCDCSVDIEFCENGEVNQKVSDFIDSIEYSNSNEYDTIFITDLSVNEEVAERIHNDPYLIETVKLLDHHKTALFLNKYSWATVHVKQDVTDEEHCGTSLLYTRLFLPHMRYKRLDKFVEAVRLWDTWLWKQNNDVEPQIYNTMLKILGRVKFMEEVIPLVSDDIIFTKEWLDIYTTHCSEKEAYINEAMNRAFIYRVDDTTSYVCVFANEHLSELGNRLALKYPECKCCLMIHDRGVSLRGWRNDVDVAEIAASFGGGGHKFAAGFNFTENTQSLIMRMLLGEI